MKKELILIVVAVVLLGLLGIFLKPEKLTEEESIKANENREILLKDLQNKHGQNDSSIQDSLNQTPKDQ